MPTQSSHYAYLENRTSDITRSLPGVPETQARSRSPKPFEFQPGEQLGFFEIVSSLGRGGTGEVYVATDCRLGRRVALKLLSRRFHADEARRRLQQEARAASSLNHPNILTVYEVGDCDGRAFIATELIDGITLREHLKRKRLGTTEILNIALQAASALGAAHAAGIVHRDIKPENIMLRPDGYVKVLDFGLAKLVTPSLGKGLKVLSIDGIQPESVVGSVPYMSPEQAQAKPLDSRSDIFSFGAVLYEMVAGARPFRGPSRTSTLDAVIHRTPAALTLSDHGSDLERVISRCLEKDVDLRFQSIGDVKRELERIQEQQDPRRHQRLLAGVIMLMLALVAGAVWGSMRPSTQHAAPVRSIPFTTLPGGEYEPAFSPDGTRIAFVWNGDHENNFDIYVKSVGSESMTRLTRDPAGDGSPVWSPDGLNIAFLRYRANTGKSEVYTIPSQGGPEVKLAEVFPREHIYDRQLDWSSDGKTLAFVDKELAREPFGIYLFDRGTSQKRALTHPAGATEGDSGPAFSPDGALLTFCRTVRTGVRKLFIVDLKDGREKEVPFESTLLSGHAWSANGKSLIVSAEHDGARGLWKVPLAGGSPELILAAKANFIAVSKVGTSIAYSQWFADTNIWRRNIGSLGSVEQHPTRIVASTLDDRSPQYSPDGSRIAFRSDRSGSKEIWMSDAEGNNSTQLTNFNGPLTGSPRWSPDGTQIAFDSRPDGQGGIFTIGAGTHALRRITSNHSDDVVPSWSHDGKWIYFASARSGGWQVWKIPVAGADRDARPITTQGGFAPQESPDGNFVYYTKDRNEHAGLWRVPVDGGAEELVLAELKAGYWGYWTVQPNAIYFFDPDGRGHAWLNCFNLATKQIRRQPGLFADPPFGDSGISISPDGKSLLYPQVDRSGSDIWLIK